VALQVTFDNNLLADRCATAEAVESEWGDYTADVVAALSVLLACPDLPTFDDLPNVSEEGGHTVFRGLTADVLLDLTCPDGTTTIVISDVSARARESQS
jgi:hypothetical protein